MVQREHKPKRGAEWVKSSWSDPCRPPCSRERNRLRLWDGPKKAWYWLRKQTGDRIIMHVSWWEIFLRRGSFERVWRSTSNKMSLSSSLWLSSVICIAMQDKHATLLGNLKVGTSAEVYSSSHRSKATYLASRQFLPTCLNECLACFFLRRLPLLQGYSPGMGWLIFGKLPRQWAATLVAYCPRSTSHISVNPTNVQIWWLTL